MSPFLAYAVIRLLFASPFVLYFLPGVVVLVSGLYIYARTSR